ncbi:glycogen synthase [bacterium]|nr:glycogen synthase [candidate division CSSED10-310 bacterium]
MKVLYVAAECKPFSKAGGVGDVAGELPPVLKRLGVDIEIVTPLYSGLHMPEFTMHFNGRKHKVEVFPRELRGVPVTFIKNDTFFGGTYGTPYINSTVIPYFDDALRFSFFSEACIQVIKDRRPDIVHVNDWVLGFLFGFMAREELPAKRVFTLHNMSYQGIMGRASLRGWNVETLLSDPRIGPLFEDPRVEWNGVNPLRLGLELAHMANTVSPTYCREITRPENPDSFFEGGKGLEGVAARLAEEGRLIGILNGIEYEWQPSHATFEETLLNKARMKQILASAFQQPERFLLGFVGRAVEQKFKLLTERIDGASVLEHILAMPDINLAVLATGLPEYEQVIRSFEHLPNFHAVIDFDPEIARTISLGSDVFLMPSLYEPCGITQMESLSMATPPLVRRTGGLADTVIPWPEPASTGFMFDGAGGEALLRNLIETIKQARDAYYQDKARFSGLQWRGFQQRFTWDEAARRYLDDVYLKVLS